MWQPHKARVGERFCDMPLVISRNRFDLITSADRFDLVGYLLDVSMVDSQRAKCSLVLSLAKRVF
tara:strand:- start:249 stop:443 length:195 start_codon:yes stop_codon:yes gene_type:complete